MAKQWDGKEWQEHIGVLLRLRHGHANYFPIPDGDRGDGGLEGFSADGCAYQCYAPKGPQSMSDLRKDLVGKITDDIAKFVKNKDDKVAKLIGAVKIRRWILITPDVPTKDILIHCQGKVPDVLAASLPYVNATDFFIKTETLDDFTLEIQALTKVGVVTVSLPDSSTSPVELQEWAGEHDELVNRLNRKLEALTLADPQVLRDELIASFISTQNKLDRLKGTFPEFWEAITVKQRERRRFVRLESATSASQPGPLVNEQVGKLQEIISFVAPGVSSADRELIAWGTVSEWLMECSLSFGKSAVPGSAS